MKVLVSSDTRFVRVDGRLYSTHMTYVGAWQRYLSVFEQVMPMARVEDKTELGPGLAAIEGEGVSCVALPTFRGPWEYLKCRGAVKAAVQAAVDQADAFILRVPSTVSTLVWRCLQKRGTPFGVEVVGDPWLALSPGAVKTRLRPYFRRRYTALLRRQVRQAAASLYVTEHALQRSYPPTPGRFTTHASNVNIRDEVVVGDVTERQRRAAELPERLQGRGEPVRLGFIGSFSQLNKAPDIHIRAAAALRQRGANVELHMVGDGHFLPAMRDLAAELGVGEAVVFHGRLPGGEPIFEFLDSTDVFVNASRQEGLPRAMIEAMARGCPAIGTKIAGIPELVGEDCLVPVDDADALAAAVQRLLGDGQRLREAIEANRRKAADYRASVLKPRREAFYQHVRQAVGADRAAGESSDGQ